jgi:hypothetical protein
MQANAVYEVYKCLSPEQKDSFLALLQNEHQNLEKPKIKKTKKTEITPQQAREYLIKSIFSKPKS